MKVGGEEKIVVSEVIGPNFKTKDLVSRYFDQGVWSYELLDLRSASPADKSFSVMQRVEFSTRGARFSLKRSLRSVDKSLLLLG